MRYPPLPARISMLSVIMMLVCPSSIASTAGSKWDLPLPGISPAAITAEFAPPTSQFGSGHRGVDFPATQGQRVIAVGSGVVSFAGSIAGKPVISIELSDSINVFGTRVRSTYEPVSPLVSTGDFVTAGTIIGYIDFVGSNSGHCRDICLHFGLKVVGEPATSYLSPRILWRSTATLYPSSVRYRILIADGQSQKSFAAFQR